jgi:hypothetical protein
MHQQNNNTIKFSIQQLYFNFSIQVWRTQSGLFNPGNNISLLIVYNDVWPTFNFKITHLVLAQFELQTQGLAGLGGKR